MRGGGNNKQLNSMLTVGACIR